jgi:hypothetical protein
MLVEKAMIHRWLKRIAIWAIRSWRSVAQLAKTSRFHCETCEFKTKISKNMIFFCLQNRRFRFTRTLCGFRANFCVFLFLLALSMDFE